MKRSNEDEKGPNRIRKGMATLAAERKRKKERGKSDARPRDEHVAKEGKKR